MNSLVTTRSLSPSIPTTHRWPSPLGVIDFRKVLISKVFGFLFNHWGRAPANALDKFKAFTPEHHIRRVPSKPREVSRVCLAPILQRTVTFTFVKSKRLIDFVKTPLRQFNRLDDGFRSALPVQDYHQFPDLRRKQALTLRPAGRTLGSRQNQLYEQIGQVGTIAK